MLRDLGNDDNSLNFIEVVKPITTCDSDLSVIMCFFSKFIIDLFSRVILSQLSSHFTSRLLKSYLSYHIHISHGDDDWGR